MRNIRLFNLALLLVAVLFVQDSRAVTASTESLGDSDSRIAFESSTPAGYTRVTLTDNGIVWGVPTKYTTDSDGGTVAYMVLGKLKGCSFATAEVARQSKVYIKTQDLGRQSNYVSETVCGTTTRSYSSWAGARITHLRFFDESSPSNIKEAVYNAATGQIEIPGESIVQQPEQSESEEQPEQSPPYARDPAFDFDTLQDAGNTSPTGIWSDGTTMWVADGWFNATSGKTKIYAYDMATKERVPIKEFNTLYDAGNTSPTGIWSDGTTMWVADDGNGDPDKIYAYDMATKERIPTKEFNTLYDAKNYHPRGIWSDGTTMWVADDGNRDDPDKIYAYDMATKERVPTKEFNTLALGNTYPYGLWSDGTTMWVTNWYDEDGNPDKIYAYNMATKERTRTREFNTWHDRIYNPTGIWSDGTTMWVADETDGWGTDKIYAYNMPANGDTPDARDLDKDFNTLDAAGNNSPHGLWSDGTTLWVTDWLDGKLYAYNLSTKAPNPDKDFNTLDAAGNDSPQGIWSDGTTLWVTDSSDDKLYAYNLSTKAPNPDKDFNTLDAAGNDSPQGIWSDGTTLWVTDSSDSKLYAYNLSTKARDPDKDFNTLGDAWNNSPQGIWSDGTTLWVTDWLDDKLYAYNLSTKARDPDKDFNTLGDAWNNSPQGIWSDGTTLWVTDSSDSKLYAYHMPANEDTPDAAAPLANTTPVFTDEASTTRTIAEEYDRRRQHRHRHRRHRCRPRRAHLHPPRHRCGGV